MWAAAIDRNGGPEVLEYVCLPDPFCADDALLIDVEAICVEGADLAARALSAPPAPQHVVGAVAAGTVVAVGAAVTGHRPGERVVTLGPAGSHATRRAVPASMAWPIPEGLSTRDAACVPVAFGTAFECLFTAGELQSGQTVLVHGGAGGVGMAAIQLARLAGATVIATASTAEKLERLQALGLHHGIDYRTQDFVAETRRLAGRHGVDLVVDSVGGATLAASIPVLAWQGRLVSVGSAGRQGSTLDAALLWPGNNSLHGVRLAAVLDADHARAFATIAECLARTAAGELSVRVATSFALADAAAAHAFIEARRAFGRVVLTTT